MTIARTRIGRIKMKAGGAEIRLLHQEKAGEVVMALRAWGEHLATYDAPPLAYVAIAFWPDDIGQPWRKRHDLTWLTRDPAMSMPMLMAQSAAQIAVEAPITLAVDRTMRTLGYVREDEDDPDDAA